MQIPAPGAACQQQAEAGKLADDGGPGGTGHAHVKGEDQQRVQPMFSTAPLTMPMVP